MSRMVSPNDMQKAAIEAMLHGRQPETQDDWALCVNFWAANVASGFEVPVCKLMYLIFTPDIRITLEETLKIATFQALRKVLGPSFETVN